MSEEESICHHCNEYKPDVRFRIRDFVMEISCEDCIDEIYDYWLKAGQGFVLMIFGPILIIGLIVIFVSYLMGVFV